jgi:hypothetical protein
MDNSYKDDVFLRDFTDTNPPVRVISMNPLGLLTQCQPQAIMTKKL